MPTLWIDSILLYTLGLFFVTSAITIYLATCAVSVFGADATRLHLAIIVLHVLFPLYLFLTQNPAIGPRPIETNS